MSSIRVTRAAVVAASALSLAACADSATAPTNVLAPQAPSLAVVIGTPPATDRDLEGQVWVCKASNSVIVQETFTFTFSAAQYANPASTLPGGTASIKNGECAMIYSIDREVRVPKYAVSITEGAMPNANWAFTSAAVTRTSYGFTNWGFTPQVSGQTISNVGFVHDIGTVVTFTNTYTPPAGCTYTQGYWKTHSMAGPAPYDAGWQNLAGGLEHNTVFYNSGKTWLELWKTPVKGSAYVQLAHQYMAAKLNVINGASAPANVTAAIAAAESYFATGTGSIAGLAALLDEFNNGLVGPGHCE